MWRRINQQQHHETHLLIKTRHVSLFIIYFIFEKKFFQLIMWIKFQSGDFYFAYFHFCVHVLHSSDLSCQYVFLSYYS